MRYTITFEPEDSSISGNPKRTTSSSPKGFNLLNVLVLIAAILSIGAIATLEETELTSFQEYENTLPVERFLDSIGVQFPLVVLAQSIEETTQDGKIFNSRICKSNFNHFGMKMNKRGYAQGIQFGHAKYNGPLDSFLDYKGWQTSMLSRVKYPVTTEEQYLYFLEHLPTNKDCTGRYAENLKYVRNLRHHLKLIKQLKSKFK